MGSSPALATCETSQVLLAGVPGGFSRGSTVFAHLLIGPSHMSCNNLERDVKLKKKCTIASVLIANIMFAVKMLKLNIEAKATCHSRSPGNFQTCDALSSKFKVHRYIFVVEATCRIRRPRNSQIF